MWSSDSYPRETKDYCCDCTFDWAYVASRFFLSQMTIDILEEQSLS